MPEDELEVLEVVGWGDHDGRCPQPLGLPGPLYRHPRGGRRAADDQGRLPLRDREVAAGDREPLGVGELVGLAHDAERRQPVGPGGQVVFREGVDAREVHVPVVREGC